MVIERSQPSHNAANSFVSQDFNGSKIQTTRRGENHSLVNKTQSERAKNKNQKILMKSLNLCLSLALLISSAHGFYVPGIAPREFTRGSKIGELIGDDVGKIGVSSTFLPLNLFCRSESGEDDINENAAAVRILLASVLSAEEWNAPLQV
jgi:hypothetical protein